MTRSICERTIPNEENARSDDRTSQRRKWPGVGRISAYCRPGCPSRNCWNEYRSKLHQQRFHSIGCETRQLHQLESRHMLWKDLVGGLVIASLVISAIGFIEHILAMKMDPKS